MSRPKTILAAALLTAISAAAATDAAAAARHYEGKVVSVNRDARSFRLRDSERGTIRIRVRQSTRFHRISGFRALTAGMKNVEVTVRRSSGRWIAIEVERSGGGGRHGADDNPSGDDDR